ncbi:MAG: MBL fold metallo-hydrolase [Thermoguttaceae bacterium]|nr:MBL fold metallo-hydrolase [Thermoguttaceae bacterium]MDW8036544.1 MBL fold metallo-hydrolase [Thermoguttaceae bacterium]
MCFRHFPHPQLRIACVVHSLFEENTYLVWLPGQSDCLIIDPGLEPEKILQALEQLALRPAAILNTHGHADHIAGNQALKTLWPDCPIVIGRADAPKLQDAWANLSRPFGLDVLSPPAEVLLDDGQQYSAAGLDLEILAISGHSAGHLVYLWKGGQPWVAFVGDVIFQDSIGRTDFPDGSFSQLRRGIREKLFSLPEQTLLLPGHGPATSVGREKIHNPFVGLGQNHLSESHQEP